MRMSLTNNRISSSQPTINQTSVNKPASRSVGNLSNYGTTPKPKQLTEGEVIKGEITDLRNNEVTVTLEDNTVVTGKLVNGDQLSIGDTAAFRIKTISINGIELEAIPKSQQLIENSTITKALEEAGLPKNDKNRLIVHELMKQSMPIDKQSIQNILIQSYSHKTVDISTLVLMTKHHLPMGNGGAEQLQNHINGNNSILPDITALTNTVSEMLENEASFMPAKDTIAFGRQLLNILYEASPADTASKEIPLISSIPLEQREELVQLLETFSIDEAQKEALIKGTLSLKDTKNLIQTSMDMSHNIDSQKQEEIRQNLLNEASKGNTPVDESIIDKELAALPKTSDLFDTPIIDSILKKYEGFQTEQNQIATFLSKEEIGQLLDMLEQFPISPALKESIYSGDASAKDIIGILKNVLAFSPENAGKELLHSKEFHKILKTYLLSEWTLKPSDLQNPQKMDKFFDKLYDQVKQLEQLNETAFINNSLNKESPEAFSSMKQNLQFTQILNDIITYIPLPMRLKEQLTHADLYVYAKKKNLAEKPSNISVLLHLDLDNLGPLDVHLTLNHNKIHSKFYLSEDESIKLLENNISSLETTLNNKGYLLETEFHTREKKVDIVKEFIEKDTPTSALKRYTFDIRA